MTEESRVGSLTLPVPQGAALEELADPTILAILDFLGFMLQTDLNSKLSQLTGTSPDACPDANRFPFDPENTFVRNPLPALYAWEESSIVTPHTLRWDALKRTIKVMYVFEELVKPLGMRARHGLMAAVAKIFAKAAERHRHPNFSYQGNPEGQPFTIPLNLLSFKMLDGEQNFALPVPDGGELVRQLRRGYPTYTARFEVLERVDQRDVTELLADGVVYMETGDDTNSTVEFMQRIAEAPDGN